VSRPGEWQLVVADVEARHGRLDGLVNNAGVLGGGPILEHTMDAWEHVIAVNQTGTFLGMKHYIPAFQRAGSGAIVNISSCAGIAPTPGAGPSYAATKAAIRLMTKSVAIDFAKQNIRVNSVILVGSRRMCRSRSAPGSLMLSLTRRRWGGRGTRGRWRSWLCGCCRVRRPLSPEPSSASTAD
jgi:NAD(P)-dependent dehydrogenase (short-subunit alcohol dehydrogenase family)